MPVCGDISQHRARQFKILMFVSLVRSKAHAKRRVNVIVSFVSNQRTACARSVSVCPVHTCQLSHQQDPMSKSETLPQKATEQEFTLNSNLIAKDIHSQDETIGFATKRVFPSTSPPQRGCHRRSSTTNCPVQRTSLTHPHCTRSDQSSSDASSLPGST